MSSATTAVATSGSEVDITNAKKLSSSDNTKVQLNPDAAVFETGSLNKDSVKKSEVYPEQETVAEMPSPQPISNPTITGSGNGGLGVTINGNEPSVFSDVPGNSGIVRQSIPDHIKPDQLPKDELRSLVRQQLEYYFSRENLAGDTYLVSQMDSDQYVLIQIVANFNQMKRLTNDIELVKEAIRESAYLQMDDSSTKMRPNMKRCIVILREVPDSTSVEEVEELFSGEGCPKYVSCEPAHNNYWYIQFESEEGAQKAYRYLREDIKTFKGKPIMARIKAKPIPRATTTNFVPKNGVRQPSEPASIHPPRFQYPVSPVFGSHQAYPFFPPNMVSQWAAGQQYFDASLIPTLSNNAYHPSHSFGKVSAHPGNRPFYQTNRNRSQTRSYREQSDRVEKDSSPPYRPRAHSTNGTSNTSNSISKSTSTINPNNSTNWRRVDDDYRRPGPRTRRRRGSSEDIRSSRSPVPQEPLRSKDDSFQINLTSSQFPPLPSASPFKTAELPLQSPTTRQDYNKVASSPPISPPVTPTSRATTTKLDKGEEARKRPTNQISEIDIKKDETNKVDTKISEPKQDTKNVKSTPLDLNREPATLNEKLSYAQIAQKTGLKVNQQQSLSATVMSTTTATTVTTVNSTILA